MSTLTARLALPVPALTDPADEHASIVGALTILDKAVLTDHGAIGLRPTSTVGSPGLAGRVYTDDGTFVTYRDWGTGWNPETIYPGSIIEWPQDSTLTTPPEGFAFCDGASQTRTDPVYSRLFSRIGTKYGAVDGTHFNLPLIPGGIPGLGTQRLKTWNSIALNAGLCVAQGYSQYSIDRDCMVELRGAVLCASLTTGALTGLVGTLAVGYRPANTEMYAAVASTTFGNAASTLGGWSIVVFTNGNITLVAPTANPGGSISVSLNGVRFLSANPELLAAGEFRSHLIKL